MGLVNLNTKGHKALYAILILLFTSIVLYNNKLVDPVSSTKELYALIFGGAAITGLIFLIIIRKNILKLSVTPVDVCFVGLWLYMFLRIILTSNHKITEYLVLVYFLGFLYYLLVRFLNLNTNNNKTELRTILFSLLVPGGIQVILGLLQLYGFLDNYNPNFRLGGTFGNPGSFSNYLALLGVLFLGIIFYSKDFIHGQQQWIKNLLIIFVVCIFVILPPTLGRTSWISALAGISFLIFFKYRIGSLVKSNKLITLIISLLVIIALFFLLPMLWNIKADSASGRLFTWKGTFEIIKENPVIGVGYNNFALNFNQYKIDFFNNHPGAPIGRLMDNILFAFNDILEFTSEYGLIWFILFVGLIVFSLTAKTQSSVATVAKAGLIVLIVQMLSSYPLHEIPVLFIAISLFIILAREDSRILFLKQKPVFSVKRTRATAFILAIPVVIIMVYGINQFTYQKQWKETAGQLYQGKTDNAFGEYNALLNHLEVDKHFLYNYGAELSTKGYHEESIAILNRTLEVLNDADVYSYLGNSYEGLGEFAAAEQAFLNASLQIPHKFYPRYRLVYLYLKQNDINRAADLADILVKEKPKVDSEIIDNIKEELQNILIEINKTLKNT